MKLLQLNGSFLSVPKAVAYKIKDKLYYNLIIGTRNRNFTYYRFMLDSKCFIPKQEGDVLELQGNNFIIVPYKINNEIVKVKNNCLYTISKDDNFIHKQHVLLFWEIPNKQYIDIKYKIKGEAKELIKASVGYERGNKIYQSPYLVIEIFGDSKLSWEGRDEFGSIYNQVITYDSSIDKLEPGIINIIK